MPGGWRRTDGRAPERARAACAPRRAPEERGRGCVHRCVYVFGLETPATLSGLPSPRRQRIMREHSRPSRTPVSSPISRDLQLAGPHPRSGRYFHASLFTATQETGLKRARGWIIHHVNFGIAMEERLKLNGVEVVLNYPKAKKVFKDERSFLIHQLKK